MPLIGGTFFDGFGFAPYRERFGWERSRWTPRRNGIRRNAALLPYLEKLAREVPKRWDNKLKKYVTNDDWLLWDLDGTARGGAKVSDAQSDSVPTNSPNG